MARTTKQAKVTDLSLSTISKENEKKYKETKRVDFPNGSKIDLSLYFRKSKIDLIVAELIDTMKDSVLEGKKFDLSTILIMRTALIIKHLSSIKIDGDTQGYEALLQLFTELKDGEYIEPIIQAYDVNEIAKVDKRINEAMEYLAKELKKDTDDAVESAESESETVDENDETVEGEDIA